ncbi:MAG: hypothetical protein K2H60_00965 [Muribaculaceae bacterium]|nr:hypothetical protein [Muribaculaceae bacterium]
MRQLIIMLLLPFISLFSQDRQVEVNDADKNESLVDNRIEGLLDDDSRNFISGKPFVFYSIGHHGQIWALICKDSTGFRIYNGTTRHWLKSEKSDLLDTLSFIENNRITLKWTFDSLSSATKRMKPVDQKVYNPLSYELILYDHRNIPVFIDNDAVFYSGSDSVNFNRHINKLSYLMFWLAAPSARKHLPIPNDTLK